MADSGCPFCRLRSVINPNWKRAVHAFDLPARSGGWLCGLACRDRRRPFDANGTNSKIASVAVTALDKDLFGFMVLFSRGSWILPSGGDGCRAGLETSITRRTGLVRAAEKSGA